MTVGTDIHVIVAGISGGVGASTAVSALSSALMHLRHPSNEPVSVSTSITPVQGAFASVEEVELHEFVPAVQQSSSKVVLPILVTRGTCLDSLSSVEQVAIMAEPVKVHIIISHAHQGVLPAMDWCKNNSTPLRSAIEDGRIHYFPWEAKAESFGADGLNPVQEAAACELLMKSAVLGEGASV